MKNFLKALLILPIASIFLLGSFILSLKKAEAQTVPGLTPIPFSTAQTGPEITNITVCCNGLEFTIEQESTSDDSDTGADVKNAEDTGTYIFAWPSMVPDPEAGMGLYSQWSVAENAMVLGNKTTQGVCVTVESECESSDDADWTVLEMGTNLVDLPAAA